MMTFLDTNAPPPLDTDGVGPVSAHVDGVAPTPRTACRR